MISDISADLFVKRIKTVFTKVSGWNIYRYVVLVLPQLRLDDVCPVVAGLDQQAVVGGTGLVEAVGDLCADPHFPEPRQVVA